MKRDYAGIDYFRFAAALLVIAIHTSPLASLSVTGDFILTRTIARIAVPFFFMTSGFFLISRYAADDSRLWRFVKKTALIYAAAILIYIPVNIYNGYFGTDNLLPNIIKDIVFDGTLYHLWYLPASVIGAVIAWYSVRKYDYKAALIATSALYFIGLFGDSYYGISEKIGAAYSFYRLVFQVSDYTRNGIFFAPVFFVLGGYISDNPKRPALRRSAAGFAVSLALMLGEALTLHHFSLQRHDSMYVFLLPSAYFLFEILLHFKGKRRTGIRTLSLIVYIIHPYIIILTRLIAKLFHLQSLLIENSLIHYVFICLASTAFGAAATAFQCRLKQKYEKRDSRTDRAYIEIDFDNLEYNIKALKAAMPPKCSLMAVVKAQAYGHGSYKIATQLEKLGVGAFAVATADEGVSLRKYGIRGEILILGYTNPRRARELKKYNLTQTLISSEYANELNGQGVRIKAHLKIDTGMHRLGIPSGDFDDIKKVFALKNISLSGMFTHLCCADSRQDGDTAFTEGQIKSFYSLVERLKQSGESIPKLHIQSSYGLLNYPNLECDYVRAGVALYGVLSSPSDMTELKLGLRPVLSLKSKVVLLRKIKKGDSVGYNRAFTAHRDSLIAVLPIGYGDGYPRNLSYGKGNALINGHKAPIVGKVCMDQLAVDVTDIPGVKVGMTATLIGKDGDAEITAPEVSEDAESISNELLSRLSHRLCIVEKAQK